MREIRQKIDTVVVTILAGRQEGTNHIIPESHQTCYFTIEEPDYEIGEQTITEIEGYVKVAIERVNKSQRLAPVFYEGVLMDFLKEKGLYGEVLRLFDKEREKLDG